MIAPVRTALAAMALVGLAHAAQAQAPGAPEMTTATYRDWTLRCARLAGNDAPPVCEVAQTLTMAQTGAPVAQIALGRLAADQPLKLVVQLPSGVWLPAHVRIEEPGGAGLTATFTACGQLCAAEALPDDGFIAALKAALTAATLTFQSGAGQPVTLEVSLNGLTAALTAMEASAAAR